MDTDLLTIFSLVHATVTDTEYQFNKYLLNEKAIMLCVLTRFSGYDALLSYVHMICRKIKMYYHLC